MGFFRGLQRQPAGCRKTVVGVNNWWDLPWCFGGDFNLTRFRVRVMGSRFTLAMGSFCNFIAEQRLVDLPLLGGRFTLSINQETPSMFRFDLFLITPYSYIHFPA